MSFRVVSPFVSPLRFPSSFPFFVSSLRFPSSAQEGWTEAGGVVFRCPARTFLEAENEHLREEVFGPCVLLVHCESEEELYRVSEALDGQLTASVFATDRYC